MAVAEDSSLGGAATDPLAPRVLVRKQVHLELGSMIAARYEVVERIGGGAMGAVYRVKDRELGEAVALKVLRAREAPDEAAREAWRQEARLARKVVHPSVCRVFDIGETSDTLFLTMEL